MQRLISGYLVMCFFMCCLTFMAASLAATLPAHALTATLVATSAPELNNPHDILPSKDGALLYVSDLGSNQVVVLDAVTLKRVSAFGGREQSQTHDVAFGPDGRLYVADTGNARIAIYRVDGAKAVFDAELKGPFRGPEGVYVSPKGPHKGRVYVAGAWSGNLVAFENGKPVKQLGNLSSPHDIAPAPDGNLWLADAGNNRMLLLTPDLEIKRELKGAPYNFNGPRYQDVLEDGTLIVADKNTHRVLAIAPSGKILFTLGTGKPGKDNGALTTPEGVAVQGQTLWIADSGNNRVLRFRLSRPKSRA